VAVAGVALVGVALAATMGVGVAAGPVGVGVDEPQPATIARRATGSNASAGRVFMRQSCRRIGWPSRVARLAGGEPITASAVATRRAPAGRGAGASDGRARHPRVSSIGRVAARASIWGAENASAIVS
jgi:hypothetical protein